MSKCEKCMGGAPYNQCCKIECHEYEFCRNCKWFNGGAGSIRCDYCDQEFENYFEAEEGENNDTNN